MSPAFLPNGAVIEQNGSINGAYAHHVARTVRWEDVGYVVVAQAGPILRHGLRPVLRANQQEGIVEFVGHDLKNLRDAPSGDHFSRAAERDGNAHRIDVAVVAFPDAEAETDLLEIIDAIDVGTMMLRREQSRQK